MTGPQFLDPPFAAPAFKIKRARTHVADLERFTADYLASMPAQCRIRGRDDLDPGDVLGFEFDFRGPGDTYGAIFGDAIHNLRTTLDLLACDLVRARGGNVKGVYFPFAESAGELDYQIKQKKFGRAGEAAVLLLKRLAPHRGGNIALRAIHDLDVQDKHVFMIPSCTVFGTPPFPISPEGKILSPPTAVVAPMTIAMVFPDESPFRDQEIIPTLHKLVETVEGVVEAFKALSEFEGVHIDMATAHKTPPLNICGPTARLRNFDGTVEEIDVRALGLVPVVQRSPS